MRLELIFGNYPWHPASSLNICIIVSFLKNEEKNKEKNINFQGNVELLIRTIQFTKQYNIPSITHTCRNLIIARKKNFLEYINIGTTCLPNLQGVITLCVQIRLYILNTRTMRTITGHGISRVSFGFPDCFRQTSLLIPRQQLFPTVSLWCY